MEQKGNEETERWGDWLETWLVKWLDDFRDTGEGIHKSLSKTTYNASVIKGNYG